jgi:hypothetical protein
VAVFTLPFLKAKIMLLVPYTRHRLSLTRGALGTVNWDKLNLEGVRTTLLSIDGSGVVSV